MTRFFSLAPLAALLVAGAAFCQQETPRQEEPLQETVAKTVAIAQQTQAQQDAWATEQTGLTARYRTAQANVAYLRGRVEAEQEQAAALRERIAEFERRLVEAARLQTGLQDTLQSIYARLRMRVEQDLPFLEAEREVRLEKLQQDLARPDVSGAERLRRLLEALQVETAYGATVELHQTAIAVDGQELSVDLLRLGRLSLFWRTPDGSRGGDFDPAAGVWRDLDGQAVRAIGVTMDMAARIRPVEIVNLPLGRIQP